MTKKKNANYANQGDDIDGDGGIVKDRIIDRAISYIRSDIEICLDIVVSHHIQRFLKAFF